MKIFRKIKKFIKNKGLKIFQIFLVILIILGTLLPVAIAISELASNN